MGHYINQNLKFYRLRNRFRQMDIAEKIHVTLGMIKTYENGSATPPVEVLIKISEMMQISIDTLIKVKLTNDNYLEQQAQTAPDLICRLEALEKIVNKKVNKISKKEQR